MGWKPTLENCINLSYHPSLMKFCFNGTQVLKFAAIATNLFRLSHGAPIISASRSRVRISARESLRLCWRCHVLCVGSLWWRNIASPECIPRLRIQPKHFPAWHKSQINTDAQGNVWGGVEYPRPWLHFLVALVPGPLRSCNFLRYLCTRQALRKTENMSPDSRSLPSGNEAAN